MNLLYSLLEPINNTIKNPTDCAYKNIIWKHRISISEIKCVATSNTPTPNPLTIKIPLTISIPPTIRISPTISISLSPLGFPPPQSFTSLLKNPYIHQFLVILQNNVIFNLKVFSFLQHLRSLIFSSNINLNQKSL